MEIERARHIHIVDVTVDDMETRILEIDDTEGRRDLTRAEVEQKSQDKRTAWLDAVYLKNSLITWRRQLKKMVDHAGRLQVSPHLVKQGGFTHTWNEAGELPGPEGPRRVGSRIKERIQDVVDEYDDKIRDCSMRVDGMAMATQWVCHSRFPTIQDLRVALTSHDCLKANGETNLEIAMATSRDSRHMRSIALVTMIFLPGTFLAVRSHSFPLPKFIGITHIRGIRPSFP